MEVIQLDLEKNYDHVLARALEVLHAGGVIVYPTDTVYGLGGNAMNTYAIERVFRMKKRNDSKPLPIIVKNLAWARELALVSPRNEKILKAIWPGQVTAVLPKQKIVLDMLTSHAPTVGMRIPDYAFTDRLLGRFGYPLIATSANISGTEPTRNIQDVLAAFEYRQHKPDLIIDAGILRPAEPSSILDLTTDKPKILRVGATKPEKLMELLSIL